MLELNDRPDIRVEQAAGGRFPILYIDNFYADPMAARELALRCAFDRVAALYPGRHAPLAGDSTLPPEEQELVREGCAYVAAMVGDFAGLVIEPDDVFTDFSAITTPARDLLKYQKHPHIDPTPVLCLVYLNPIDMGGTSFWYNRAIDRLALVTPEDHAAYQDFLAKAPTGEPRERYEMMHTDSWEKVHRIDGVFNRFVAYPANIFHWAECLSVPEPPDLRKSRLTQRFSIAKIGRPS